MWSKPVCTNRKSASAERCLRALGATLAMGIPVMRRSKHSRQGVFSHQGLRKASAADPVNTGLAGSAGMAVRYMKRMFKAGVLTAGELTVSEEGVPQGSCCSPVLANIFAHHVLDTWFEGVVKPHCRGQVALYRYADDAVICCQYARDAERILRALRQQLAKYRLRLHEEKTQLVPFSKQAARRGEPQGTFEFLGFLFY